MERTEPGRTLSGASRIDDIPDELVPLLSRGRCNLGDVVGGRYRLVRVLGNGGMGQVYVAENLAIGRQVAVKMLKAELLADSVFRRRFQKEAEAIAAIDHRNVVRFLDLVVGDPTFLVMEYVTGPTLAAVLANGRLAPNRALHIGARLCWALDAVHRSGVVHRDIKPANVILTPDSETHEEPKLIDFGLAKWDASDPLTRTGQIVGTPQYMSPEQISGGDIDARSDVYALGCLLYHLVAGRPAFGGANDVQVLYKQIESTHESVRSFAPDAPEGLDAVLARALAKNPDERYASAREMAEALQALGRRRASDVIGHDAPAETTGVTRMPERRLARGWPVIAAVAAAVALAAGWVAARLTAPSGSARDAARLLVGTHPNGATLAVDGKPWPESTPTTVTGLAPGQHVVRMMKAGYAPVEQAVALSTGERSLVDLVLTPQSRTVQVETVPSGATVYLDGHMAFGHTPLAISVSEGDFHEVRVEQKGFTPFRQALKPEDSQTQLTIHLVPEKQARGVLWVDSDRLAEVFVDDVDTGFATPTLGLDMPVGPHVVEVRDGAARVSGKVVVGQGDVVHIRLGLPSTATEAP